MAATVGYSPDRLQVQSIKFAGSSAVYSVTLSRSQNGGNNGQITSVTDSVDSGRSINYAYDALGRLSTAQTTGDSNYPQWGLSFTYDRYGNRTAQTVTAGTAPSNSVTVSATTNQITTPGYSYDANGNVTNDGVNTLSYDAENRLLTASGSYGSGTYSYGIFGNRAVKSSSGNITVSIYDGNRIIAEYNNGTLANEYIYIDNQLISSRLSGTLYYHAFDHQSIRVHLNSSGSIVGQKGQYPFGEDWYTSSISNRHFTSYVRDSESVNDNAMHRFYVNRLARFSAVDPAPGGGKSPQRFNLYSYVGNDPVNHADPDGRHLIDCDAWIGCGDAGGDGGSGGLPNNQCIGFLDPSCGCNPDNLEGNSCPPSEPVPAPPQQLPSGTCNGNCIRDQLKPSHTGIFFWRKSCEYTCNFDAPGPPYSGDIATNLVSWGTLGAAVWSEYHKLPKLCPSAFTAQFSYQTYNIGIFETQYATAYDLKKIVEITNGQR